MRKYVTRRSQAIYKQAQQRTDVTAEHLTAIYTLLAAADSTTALAFMRDSEHFDANICMSQHPFWPVMRAHFSQRQKRIREKREKKREKSMVERQTSKLLGVYAIDRESLRRDNETLPEVLASDGADWFIDQFDKLGSQKRNEFEEVEDTDIKLRKPKNVHDRFFVNPVADDALFELGSSHEERVELLKQLSIFEKLKR